MTAPTPSPAEQATIDRFGIFDEERVVDAVARAIFVSDGHEDESWDEPEFAYLLDDYRANAVAAVAAYRAKDGGAEEAVLLLRDKGYTVTPPADPGLLAALAPQNGGAEDEFQEPPAMAEQLRDLVRTVRRVEALVDPEAGMAVVSGRDRLFSEKDIRAALNSRAEEAS